MMTYMFFILPLPFISVFLSSSPCFVFFKQLMNWNTRQEKRPYCLSCVTRPPSTATVIGIQCDGESLLEERRGGDSQKGCSGETNHATFTLLCVFIPLAFPNIYRHLIEHTLLASVRFSAFWFLLITGVDLHWNDMDTSLITFRKAKLISPVFWLVINLFSVNKAWILWCFQGLKSACILKNFLKLLEL